MSKKTGKLGIFDNTLRINKESVVPYVVKNNVKHLPLFYFEGEIDHLKKLKLDSIDTWDLAYLKFCCKVQGIRNDLYASDICKVVAVEEIRGYFPSETIFEDYWPVKGSLEAVKQPQHVSGKEYFFVSL